MSFQSMLLKHTLVIVVSSQPFAFGTAGGSDDADCFTALHQQVILADLSSHDYLSVVQRLLLPSDLEDRRRRSQWTILSMVLKIQLN